MLPYLNFLPPSLPRASAKGVALSGVEQACHQAAPHAEGTPFRHLVCAFPAMLVGSEGEGCPPAQGFGQQRLFGNPWDTPVIAQAPCVRTSQRPESAGAPPQVIPTTCHGWPGDQVTTCHGWRAKPSEHCEGQVAKVAI